MIETEPLAEAPVVYTWRYTLSATPEALWPLVSDTNRMNRLAGMATARFEDAADGSARTGHTTMLGLGVKWDEHPFEWVYPLGFSVRRDFHNGVLKAYRSSVTLEALPTGTHLTHRVELVPRLGLMAPFVKLEGARLERHWAQAYASVDAWLAETGPYPFEPEAPGKLTDDARALSDAVVAAADDPDLTRALFAHVLKAHPSELVHVRPFMLADRWRLDREAVLLACIQLARRALLKAQWSLLCPHCRGAKGTVDSLDALAASVQCASCNLAVGRLTDSVVELSFRPDPRYRAVEETTYCVGGPGSTPHISFQSRMQPGTTREIGVKAAAGGYRLRASRVGAPFDFQYHVTEPAAPLQVGEAAKPQPTVSLRPDGVAVVLGEPRQLDGDKLRLTVTNDTDWVQDVVVETRGWREDVISLAWLKQRPELALELLRPAEDDRAVKEAN